jgi:hypothetical protein
MMIGLLAITITTMPMRRVTQTRFPPLVTITKRKIRQMQIIQLTMRQTMTRITVPQKMEPLGKMLPLLMPQQGMTVAPQEETALAEAAMTAVAGAVTGVATVAATVAAATVVAAAVAAAEEAAEVEIDAFLSP